MIKTFRGIIADGGQDRIRLSTKKGKIGYRIVKFQIFFEQPGVDSQDSIVQLWKIKQASVSTGNSTVDFADGNLLGVAQIVQAASVLYQTTTGPIIFDREIFNQDIYVTHTDQESTYRCNYYLELETMTLSDNATVVSTLRDIRLNPQVGA
jgi:hypothetical protein